MRRLACALLLTMAVFGRTGAQEAPAARVVPVADIAGIIFDSVAMRPLADAVVQLATVPRRGTIGAMRSARTDSAGIFRFAAVAAGTYLLGFQHLALDTLGLHAPVHRADIRRAGTVRVSMALPSMGTIVARACGREASRDSVALLVGSVRDSHSDQPVAGGFVSIRWGELYLSHGTMQRATPTVDVFADDQGWFTACVPAGTPVAARAAHERSTSGELELTLSSLTVLRRDLYVGESTQRIVGAGDSVRASGVVNDGDRLVSAGDAVVRGRVRAATGKPLEGARVALAAGSGMTETRTDAKGEFFLTQLPKGSYALEARALGYLPDQRDVDIVDFRDASLDFVLVDLRAALLDTVRIEVSRQLELAARAAFDRRRRSGAGLFIDDAMVDSMRPQRFSDLMRSLPGVRFTSGRTMDDALDRWIEIGGSRGTPCSPSVYLNGQLLTAGRTDLDGLIDVSGVRRVEVYTRGLAPPAEFASFADCGVVAVWTSARGGTAFRPQARR